MGGEGEDYFWADELFVSTAGSEASLASLTGRHHLAIQAADVVMVKAFHRAAVAHGGVDNAAPGQRPYHPGYCAAFVLDPDGNKHRSRLPRPCEAQRACSGVRFD